MKITKKYLDDNKTSFGAWTQVQLESVGINWPPTKGWQKSIIGNDIPEDVRAIFEREGFRVFKTKRNGKAKPKSMQPKLTQKQKRKLKKHSRHDFYDSQEWRELRYSVLKHYGFKCMACGRSPKKHGVVLHVDHIKPRSKFPELELDPMNLQVLCEDCNLGKLHRYQDDLRPIGAKEEFELKIVAQAEKRI